MKKTKRSLLCLMLAVLMVMSCAITAMAISDDVTKVEVRNYLYSEENDVYGYTRWVPNTGYATVASSANNLLRLGAYDVPSKVVSTSGKFYIGNELVTTQLNVV